MKALAGYADDDEPIAEELLADLRTIFQDEATMFDSKERDRLSTARVTELLMTLDSKPWATYNTKTGKPITQHQVARLLKRFDVRPDKARIADKSVNCYLRKDLQQAWNRYSLSLQLGTAKPTNDSGPESTISGRNPHGNGSDLKTAVSSMNTGTVPRFQLENPSVERERVEL